MRAAPREPTACLAPIDDEPMVVFSGGSPLIFSTGLPDLLGPERASTPARRRYGSLRRLADLPGDVRLPLMPMGARFRLDVNQG
ncbi:hypothetical protein [Streptosporangium sp. NPDC006930]|uniref:hypothetical protein n=1 Tax=unclassified Streptosporangium TaxID=2632669 RepID=UPI00343A58AD